MTANQSWLGSNVIHVVTDPPKWFSPFAKKLVSLLCDAGFDARYIDRQRDVRRGGISFFLSCTGITPPEILAESEWNVVVHASPLPLGRGFSPLVWQILEGKDDIPLTMITMSDEPDEGDIVMERWIHFEGHELNAEMRKVMGEAIVEMCFDFALSKTPPEPKKQEGDTSWYRRRGPADSELDPAKSLKEQFNLLRTVDNEHYPAYFYHLGKRYNLAITKANDEGASHG